MKNAERMAKDRVSAARATPQQEQTQTGGSNSARSPKASPKRMSRRNTERSMLRRTLGTCRCAATSLLPHHMTELVNRRSTQLWWFAGDLIEMRFPHHA